MNRFHMISTPAAARADQSQPLEHALLESSHTPGLDYSLFAPLHYERNYAYPLVIWLHGPGQDERQLQRIMPLVSMQNYVSIGPRGPRRCEAGRAAYTWSECESDIAAAETSIFACLEVARAKFNVAAHRVFLAGYQAGGTMAFRVGMKSPEKFAGVLSLGGPFPTGNSPLAHFVQARQLPLFIAQGRHSERYSVETTCQELRLFHCAGMHVTLRQYPGGDELTPQMLGDMNGWIMEQVTGITTTETQSLSSQYGDDT
ncbi:MAG: alpha/beta hydrolase [Pirellulaceae bacterium]